MSQLQIQSIFDTLRADPKFHARRSQDWFQKKINELKGQAPIDKDGLLKNTKDLQSNKLLPSTMVFFSYDPKLKETLPYYDMFPLSFVFSVDDKGFTGINFHYLPQIMRIKLYDAMYKIASMSKLPTQQVMALSWAVLQNASKFPGAQVAVKRYLWSHVRSKFIRIPIEDWKTAIMLENAQFKKVSAGNVRTITSRMFAGMR